MKYEHKCYVAELHGGGRIWLDVESKSPWEDGFPEPENILEMAQVSSLREISKEEFDLYGFSALPTVYTFFDNWNRELGYLMMEDAPFSEMYLGPQVARCDTFKANIEGD